jgi:hypothetical protein
MWNFQAVDYLQGIIEVEGKVATVTLTTTNPTWNTLELNLSLCHEKPAPSLQRHAKV